MPDKKPHPYVEHLAKDKKFAQLLKTAEPLALKKKKNLCLHLCASIMSQQLSVKVAKVIYHRFLELYGGKEPTPQQIVGMAPEKLRAIGLSNAKVAYVQNVARHAIVHGMEDKKLYAMSDEEVMEFLLPIKGVGRWTVEMQLMFALGREDVFAVDDLGIQQGMAKLYKLDMADKKAMREKMLKISEKWKPYRTYACMHLWRWKDN
ncbi:DNA-3-methyladenine glycosylase family protein [Polluticoccus soli]|uniref:DNA-3-methyladenine glycosylase family protein n=1 Tax=Polluticoccus soli TaxID=3034150 RepID=UPI0023E1389B|nr:DNA-3-methyladenine glycosylase 2 family protein [Flavipsychrobacter sp. JY13-12]